MRNAFIIIVHLLFITLATDTWVKPIGQPVLAYICRVISGLWCSERAYSETTDYLAVSFEKIDGLPRMTIKIGDSDLWSFLNVKYEGTLMEKICFSFRKINFLFS